MRNLESGSARETPRDLVTLQAAVAESLKRVEFELWRRFGAAAGSRPAVGDAGSAPAGYRKEVEEYFRAIGRERR
ncbi:MAG: hypothetical protein CVV20_03010 [Gemmatimonadetes bacterium HGW-Gemmatimonadetes-1]|nr:MAG: hypothetical protein CVV20_03010 [Gemmatimonadetes bacterium HGW-Gemmatimonadetes-1]